MSKNQGPEYLDSHGAPGVIRFDLEVIVTYDDVTTVAAIVDKDTHIQVAVGVSKRYKRDKRNMKLGHDLAVSRAFGRLAERYGERADKELNPPPNPAVQAENEALKVMKRHNRAEQKKRKNDKRRAAREAWFASGGRGEYGGDVDEWRGRAFGDWS